MGLLRRTIKQWRNDGTHAWVTTPIGMIEDLGGIAISPLVIRKARQVPADADLDTLARMIKSRHFYGVIKAIQVQDEIVGLLKEVRTLRPRRLMEIGTARGGTLFTLMRAADPQALVISLDLPGGKFGGGYPWWKSHVYRKMALPGQRVELLRADSHTQESLDRVKQLLAGEPLDFLFIDGDHTYEGVRKDFEMYAPLVRPGGIIGFHDINACVADRNNHSAADGGDVPRFWHELKSLRTVQEFIAGPGQGFGIGIVKV